MSIPELLGSYSRILRELRRRGVIRTSNNPLGDYAEWIVADRLNLKLSSNSNAGYDAVDGNGVRYQIKSRRVTPENPSTQLGAIRELDKQDFDYLIAILFDADFTILKVVQIPHAVVGDYSRFVERTNSHRLFLQGLLLRDPRTQDLTSLFERNDNR